jgi:hypothetical protein
MGEIQKYFFRLFRCEIIKYISTLKEHAKSSPHVNTYGKKQTEHRRGIRSCSDLDKRRPTIDVEALIASSGWRWISGHRQTHSARRAYYLHVARAADTSTLFSNAMRALEVEIAPLRDRESDELRDLRASRNMAQHIQVLSLLVRERATARKPSA